MNDETTTMFLDCCAPEISRCTKLTGSSGCACLAPRPGCARSLSCTRGSDPTEIACQALASPICAGRRGRTVNCNEQNITSFRAGKINTAHVTQNCRHTNPAVHNPTLGEVEPEGQYEPARLERARKQHAVTTASLQNAARSSSTTYHIPLPEALEDPARHQYPAGQIICV